MQVNPDEFENELRAALGREAAPPGFARRLRARLPIPIWRRPVVWAIAAALLLAALVPPAVSEYQKRQQERAVEAHRQLVIALRITSVKLRQVRERVHRSTTRHTS
jgi:hypothetical protein